jgi:preprotein translocase subunit SecD
MSARARIALILGIVLVCTAVLAYAVFRVVVVPRGPLRGRAAFELTLAAVERFDASDARTMVARLEALGARASIVSADDARVVLRVEETTTPEAVQRALRPLRLAVHQLVTFPATTTFPDGIARPEPSRAGVNGPCEVLRPWVATEAPGCHVALEALDDGTCAAHCLVDPPVLTRTNLVDAEVIDDPMTGAKNVSLVLDARGASAFDAFTAAHVGEHLAVVVDDVVWMAPRIQERIPGGRLWLMLPEGEDAAILAGVLRTTGEIAPWTLEVLR